jgi:hypothetical protein
LKILFCRFQGNSEAKIDGPKWANSFFESAGCDSFSGSHITCPALSARVAIGALIIKERLA